jgi:hypothetical protein
MATREKGEIVFLLASTMLCDDVEVSGEAFAVLAYKDVGLAFTETYDESEMVERG